MYLQYGTYRHDDGECAITIDRKANETEAGVPYSITHNWVIRGQLQATSPAELQAKIVRLETAYSYWYGDLTMYGDGGLICHQLLNAGSLGGTRIITPPSFPDGSGAQYTTYRDYVIGVEAEYPFGPGGIGGGGGGGFLLKQFRETVSFTGGGMPRRVVLETMNGVPHEQIVALSTVYRASQQGTAVGYYGYPPPADPIWPDAIVGDPQITRTSAETMNGFAVNFGVTWAYEFASPFPLIGGPNQFPAG